jgi:hypothetical protein
MVQVFMPPDGDPAPAQVSQVSYFSISISLLQPKAASSSVIGRS